METKITIRSIENGWVVEYYLVDRDREQFFHTIGDALDFIHDFILPKKEQKLDI